MELNFRECFKCEIFHKALLRNFVNDEIKVAEEKIGLFKIQLISIAMKIKEFYT